MAIGVTVFKMQGRKNFVAQWVDPVTGKKKTRSTETSNKRDAERFAGNLARDLESGTYDDEKRLTWESFRLQFEKQHLPQLAPNTQIRYQSVFNTIETLINPKLVASLTPAVINQYSARLRENGRSEATIKTNLTHLKSALKWGVDNELIRSIPKIRMPKYTDGMKGRPITYEELERLIEKIPVIESKTPDEWEFLLRGLWWSGLRLGEALDLHWTEDSKLCVDLDNEVIIIQAAAQKGKRFSITPMAPEFTDFLAAVPEEKRKGFVFNPIGARDRSQRIRVDTASKLISQIGKAAGVKVSETQSGKVKFASAHDLRRAFGTRWATRILPTELRELMRHQDIKTTLTFYAELDAKQTVKKLRAAVANTLANTPQNSQQTDSVDNPQDVIQ